MDITVGTASLIDLNSQLQTVGRSLDRKTVGPALVDAAKPMLIALKQETPVGSVPRYRSSTVVRGSRKGQARSNSGTYARGGATRRDARLKAVDGNGAEVARVLVGVSKRSGKVGWRTHFLTGGSTHNRADNFIQRAYDRTIDVVKARFMGSLRTVVAKILTRAQR